MNAAKSPEQRREASRKGNAVRSPEQRSQGARKGHETRRQKAAAKADFQLAANGVTAVVEAPARPTAAILTVDLRGYIPKS
jgi:hypothetical protein